MGLPYPGFERKCSAASYFQLQLPLFFKFCDVNWQCQAIFFSELCVEPLRYGEQPNAIARQQDFCYIALYGTAQSGIFYRAPAGYTAKKMRRKRDWGYQGLLSIAHQPLPPPPFPPHTARLLHCLGLRYQDIHPPPFIVHSHGQKSVISRKSG